MQCNPDFVFPYYYIPFFFYFLFFGWSSLVTRNFTFKVDKWDDWSSNLSPRIYNAMRSTNKFVLFGWSFCTPTRSDVDL
jgi:hypothetical protein